MYVESAPEGLELEITFYSMLSSPLSAVYIVEKMFKFD